MNRNEYFALADNLAQEAGVTEGLHGYFRMHRTRLWKIGFHFGTWQLRGKAILDIGPFFSYLPFALKEQGNSVTVLEGRDPAINPLIPLYEKRQIAFSVTNLLDVFQAANPQERRLPYAADQFDIINCWENMEHFNFNPVGFVKELHRVLKPGGETFITVPNMAKLEYRVRLLFGCSIQTPIADYCKFYDYDDGRFLGFHWREYVISQLAELFEGQKFQIASMSHLETFVDRDDMSASRTVSRLIGGTLSRLVPSLGRNCCLHARKPSNT